MCGDGSRGTPHERSVGAGCIDDARESDSCRQLPVDQRLRYSWTASVDAHAMRGLRAKGSGGQTEKIAVLLETLVSSCEE